MTAALPPLVCLTGTVAIGLWMASRYLRGLGRDQSLLGFHFLLGAAGLMTGLLLVGEVPAAARGMGSIGLGVLTVTLIGGITVALFLKPKAAKRAIFVHGGLGLVGFIIFVLWALKL